MSLSSYNPHERYRKRYFRRVLNVSAVLLLIGSFVALGIWFGKETAAQHVNRLQAQLKELQLQRDELQDTATALRVEAQTANMRMEQLRVTYEDMISEGPMEELIELMHKQLDEGMDPKRLAFFIRSARPPHNCSEPETEHFVIATPAYVGPESSVRVADGAIVIKGAGASAKNAEGAAEVWYDPSKAIAVEFVLFGGKTEQRKGVMPLYHSVVAGGREYRFTIEEGARSFAKVTYDSCDYP